MPVEMVVYPGEAHGLRRPDFEKDLLERELAWLDHFVLGKGAGPSKGPSSAPYGGPK